MIDEPTEKKLVMSEPTTSESPGSVSSSEQLFQLLDRTFCNLVALEKYVTAICYRNMLSAIQ